MPPTRGHDLKPMQQPQPETMNRDAPHTGARLETMDAMLDALYEEDAPHTGARLETPVCKTLIAITDDAPHTGARLETRMNNRQEKPPLKMPPTRGHDLKHCSSCTAENCDGCPPHGGTT